MITRAYQIIIDFFAIIDKTLYEKSLKDGNTLQYYLWLKKGYNALTIDDLYTITELDLSYSLIIELPSEFSYLTTLEHLDLSGNYIIEVPKWIWSMGNLKELILGNHITGGNPIEKIPVDIKYLQKLEILDIRNLYMLKTLPIELSELKNLSSLYMTQNDFYKSNVIQKVQKETQCYVMLDEPFPFIGNLS